MTYYLQQRDSGLKTIASKAGIAVANVRLSVNKGLLLVLVLVIIPTISGVALIA